MNDFMQHVVCLMWSNSAILRGQSRGRQTSVQGQLLEKTKKKKRWRKNKACEENQINIQQAELFAVESHQKSGFSFVNTHCK